MSRQRKKHASAVIYLDDEQWRCSGFRKFSDNLRGAWLKLWADYGGEYLPKSRADFERRGGRVDWYVSS